MGVETSIDALLEVFREGVEEPWKMLVFALDLVILITVQPALKHLLELIQTLSIRQIPTYSYLFPQKWLNFKMDLSKIGVIFEHVFLLVIIIQC